MAKGMFRMVNPASPNAVTSVGSRRKAYKKVA